MTDIMKEVEGKVKFSMADSTMMLLVQQAMDKAHEKIKTKHGILLRLNAISIFYELAVLQLESCLNFVKQETDNLESNHEEVVRDLREIKDRLHHRLLETELAILEKDRELLERSENEESLRNVLESKETELVHLQDLERNRTSHNKIGDFIKEDEFSELKSSVDKQVINLRQKLETEYEETEDPSGVEIDALKGTMDLAFNKMHHAIFLSKLGPIEQSWRWSIERDSMALLIKGFLNSLEEKKKKVMMAVRDYQSGFKDRVFSIRREVECLESQIDQVISHRSSPKSSVEPTTSFSVDCEIGDDNKEEDSSNLPVSKLIKSHEWIIRRKSEELVPPLPPKIESVKRSKSSKRAIDDIVAGLDSLMSLTIFDHLFDDDDENDRYDHVHDHGMVTDDSLDDVWMKMQEKRSVISENVKEENEYAEMKLMILEDTYLTLLKGLLTDEITNNRKAEVEESESEKIESVHKCRDCLEKLKWEKEFEILREDEEFRQELDWIIVTELLREVSETMKNHEKIEAKNKKMMEEERNRACLEMCLLFDDFGFKIQERLKMVNFRLQNVETKIHATMDCVAELRRKESVYRTDFILRTEKDSEILCEDEEFRQEVDWIIVTESLREVSETVKNHEKIEAINTKIIEKEGNRACLEMSIVFDDFDFKIQEKLKMVTVRLQNLETEIHSTLDCIAELRRKESVYRTAFVVRSENLIKAENEVDLLGYQVDSLVKILQKTLWTFHQHPLLLCNYSDISEISKMIKKELSFQDS